jgi:hypothetical protein
MGLKFDLQGADLGQPQNIKELEFEASFDNTSPMANLTTKNLIFGDTYSKKPAEEIIAYATGAKGDGFFSGPDLNIKVDDDAAGTLDFLECIINFTDNYQQLHATKVSINVQDKRSQDRFEDRVSGLTFGSLLADGTITSADFVDVDYLIETLFDLLEQAILYFMLFSMLQQIYVLIKDTAESISTASALATAGITGTIAAAIYITLILISSLIYFALLIISIIDVVEQILPSIFPPKKKFKGMNYRVMLTKIAAKLGYNFSSSITDLDFMYSLPTKERKNDIASTFIPYPDDVGIYRVKDYGYICSEFLSECVEMFTAKFLIVDNVLHFEPELNDSFWVDQSTLTLPNLLLENPEKAYNADEMIGRKIFEFKTDVKDDWTRNNFEGNSAEIITYKPSESKPENTIIKGFKRTTYNSALGTRKSELKPLESLAKTIAKAADDVVNFLGGNSNLESLIGNRIGLLKVTNQFYDLPKVLYMKNLSYGLRIPADHRNHLSAKSLYLKYGIEKSFVANNFRNQWRLFTDRDIPFNFDSFTQLARRNYGYVGNSAMRFDSVKWNEYHAKASGSFRVREIYDSNLAENIIEPK